MLPGTDDLHGRHRTTTFQIAEIKTPTIQRQNKGNWNAQYTITCCHSDQTCGTYLFMGLVAVRWWAMISCVSRTTCSGTGNASRPTDLEGVPRLFHSLGKSVHLREELPEATALVYKHETQGTNTKALRLPITSLG